MKKIILIWICVLMALCANANIKFKSLYNYDGKTTIVLVDDNFKSDSETCCAKFHNDFKTYDAKTLETIQEGDQMLIRMTFEQMTVFNNTSCDITINGKQINVPIPLTEIVSVNSGS